MDEHTVDVWWATVADAHPGLIDMLPSTDIERIQRLQRPADRDARLVAWSLTRRVLGDVLDQAPRLVPISRQCRRCGSPDHGKPRVEARMSFSLSHSGDNVLLAMSCAGDVGADVEHGSVSEETAAMILSPDEAPGDLMRYWVRKEAVLKATGDGLAVPMTTVAVTHPSAPPALLGFAQHDGLEAQVRLIDLEAPLGYAAAVAVLGPVDRIHSHDGSVLLSDSRHG